MDLGNISDSIIIANGNGRQSIVVDSAGTISLNGNVVINGIMTAWYYDSDGVLQQSDARLKTNVQPILDSLTKIQQLKGVTFDWKESNDPSIGFIAQEVEPTFPELVSTNATTGLKSLNYSGIIPVLVEGMKEQQKQLDEYKKELDLLREQVKGLR